MRWKSLALALGALALFQAGWIAGSALGTDAWAETPDSADTTFADTEPAPYPGRLRCSMFEVPLGSGQAMTLPDGTTEAGQWVQQQEDEWQLFSTDLEISQKPTGYPQAWLQVCLYPR